MTNNKYSAMIVDDSAESRIIVARLLKNLGFEKIESAENGKTGLLRVLLSHPNIVFLDGIMPEMDGLSALREIKKTSPQTIVIISSSISDKEQVMQFRDSGADFYLLKPFERLSFEEVTNKAMAKLDRQKGIAA